MSVRISFFIPAHPTYGQKDLLLTNITIIRYLTKRNPIGILLPTGFFQRCIKSYHLTPFDCVTDEAPHRQIPYKRRPFRSVRVFQISQDSLDYFLVAVQYLRKVVAIEHSEQILNISPRSVIRFLGPAFIEHLLSVLHRPSSLGSVSVKHLVGGFPSQLLGKVISMGVYVPLIIRVIGVCSSVVTTPASPAHIRFGTFVLVTDAALTEPSPATVSATIISIATKTISKTTSAPQPEQDDDP